MAHDKRLAKGYEGFDRTKSFPLGDALAVVKRNATAKFDETIEISMNLGIDPRHADQMVRGLVNLPNGTGKTVRVGVFARGAKAEEAAAAGADVVGAEDLAEKVQAGEINFDRCIATPDMMPVVGSCALICITPATMPGADPAYRILSGTPFSSIDTGLAAYERESPAIAASCSGGDNAPAPNA